MFWRLVLASQGDHYVGNIGLVAVRHRRPIMVMVIVVVAVMVMVATTAAACRNSIHAPCVSAGTRKRL